MDSNIALKTYITTQRENGISDEAIYKSLLASGWQQEAVEQALSMHIDRVEAQAVAHEAAGAPTTSNPAASTEKGMHKGRLSRIGFLIAHVYIFAYFALAFLIAILGRGSAVANSIVFLLGGLGVLMIMILPFFFYARRWHDINQSGWLALLLLIPGAAVPIAIILLIIPGTRGANQYGVSHQKTLSPAAIYGLST
jgi:uncharacterized membrane protein YhaH (DUF805 family)